LLVDDSAVIRRTLSEVLPFEVIGAAANGKIALALIPQLNPDVIVLDLEMPEMDGLQTLAALRPIYKSLPVIVFSTQSARGAAATLDALELGADDYVLKPTTIGTTQNPVALTAELAQKIRVHCRRLATGKSLAATASPSLSAPPRAGRICTTLPKVIAIGVSTGGPRALAEILPRFPADLPVPVLIVQHMPRLFTKLLADRLAAKSRIQVSEACGGDRLTPGHAWIAPGDFHMTVRNSGGGVLVAINQEPPENSCRPAVDVLFRSVAAVYGAGALAVVMTGMGQDGLRGCTAIRENHGNVIVQDEASSVVWGMPGAVAHAGLAESIVPLDGLAELIMRQVRPPAGGAPPPAKTTRWA